MPRVVFQNARLQVWPGHLSESPLSPLQKIDRLMVTVPSMWVKDGTVCILRAQSGTMRFGCGFDLEFATSEWCCHNASHLLNA